MSRLTLAAALGFAALGWGFTAGTAAAAPGDATEKLLKDAKLDYKKTKESTFRVVIETKEGTSVVAVEERKAAWKDNKGGEVLYVYVYTEVLTTAIDFKPPTGMLTKIAEVNDRTIFGNLSLVTNPDKSSSVFRNGTLFLKNLDAEQLDDLIYLTHSAKFSARKELLPFLEDK